MAHLDKIPSDLLQKINDEITDFGSTAREGNPADPNVVLESAGPAPANSLQATDTLQVWKLKPGTLETLTNSSLAGDLFDWVQPTSYLHHLIRLDGTPVGFARSTNVHKEKTVAQINFSANSGRSSRINQALEMIERNEQGDQVVASNPVVRLLEIPSYHIVALWLYAERLRKSRVVIVNAAKRYQQLAQGVLLNSEEFFDALKRGGKILDVA
jgi:hypothetical protein